MLELQSEVEQQQKKTPHTALAVATAAGCPWLIGATASAVLITEADMGKIDPIAKSRLTD
jgi:hypothetical protein